MVAMVTRAQWGAGGSTAGRHVALSQRRWFVAHWPGGAVPADERQAVRNIDAFHRNSQRWAVIGYNFLIGRSGTIYEGAGLNVRGIHSPPRNVDGFGVCFLKAPGEQMTQPMRNSGRALYDWLNRQAGRTLGRAGHSTHWATACPGPAVIAWVNAGMPGAAPPPPPPPPPPPAGRLDSMSSVAFRQTGPPANTEETFRVFRRATDNRVMFSRNAGPYQQIGGTNARGAVDIAASPSGWLVISYINMQGRVMELRGRVGAVGSAVSWTLAEMGGPA